MHRSAYWDSLSFDFDSEKGTVMTFGSQRQLSRDFGSISQLCRKVQEKWGQQNHPLNSEETWWTYFVADPNPTRHLVTNSVNERGEEQSQVQTFKMSALGRCKASKT